ncbi:MAG: flavodoxin [Bacteroidales bacterium]|nr:flavodoxin [Bacteroidales bacterium]
MKKTALIYWPTRGSVELNANRIHKALGEANVDLMRLKNIDPVILQGYDFIVLGCSTVGADAWQDAWSGNLWSKFFSEIKEKKVDLSGKKIAIFGLGDQILYPDHFVDEMTNLKNEFESLNATLVGKWPSAGYEHTESRSEIDGYFIGLALDEGNQDDLSEERIEQWVSDLKKNDFH